MIISAIEHLADVAHQMRAAGAAEEEIVDELYGRYSRHFKWPPRPEQPAAKRLPRADENGVRRVRTERGIIWCQSAQEAWAVLTRPRGADPCDVRDAAGG